MRPQTQFKYSNSRKPLKYNAIIYNKVNMKPEIMTHDFNNIHLRMELTAG